MTRELLNKIVKAHKINLDWYDHVSAVINDNYTFITVSFWAHEVSPSGHVTRCDLKKVRLSVSAILKREEEFPEDYETGWYGKWIFEIR